MLNFCTLFNTGYLAKGLALHRSLVAECPQFQLYIFAFDDNCYKILTEKKLISATIIALREFENEALLEVKKERSVAEYCWTCTPLTIEYCIQTYKLDHCTYLDADTFFYDDPTVLINEMGDNSVLITPHNYHILYDQRAESGIYCVQFITFKNTDEGMTVLNWWAGACLKWCYARYEDGKMGDQKYLDSWPYMFNGVYISKNINAGIAPWNAMDLKSETAIENIIFYHFHDLQYISDGSWFVGGYDLPQIIIDKIYRPYIKLLKSISGENNIIDSLNTKNKSTFHMLTPKYKLGIYIIDFKAAFRNFGQALFFTGRRRFYKNNFIK